MLQDDWGRTVDQQKLEDALGPLKAPTTRGVAVDAVNKQLAA